MATSQSSFDINVNLNGVDRKGTQPSIKKGFRPTTVSGSLKKLVAKNGTLLAVGAAAAMSVGKTYVDLQFSKSENTNAANRFNTGLKFAGYGMTIAGGAAAFNAPGAAVATVYVGAQIVNDVQKYNTFLAKRNIRFNYTNEKYKQSVANGTRWRGGSI